MYIYYSVMFKTHLCDNEASNIIDSTFPDTVTPLPMPVLSPGGWLNAVNAINTTVSLVAAQWRVTQTMSGSTWSTNTWNLTNKRLMIFTVLYDLLIV